MHTQSQTAQVRIPYPNGHFSIPKWIVQQYAKDLSNNPHFSAHNVDIHMSFLYTGNLLVVHEFLSWYNSHENFDKLEITPKIYS